MEDTKATWKLKPTTKRIKIEGFGTPVRGTGWVLFGNRKDTATSGKRWLERRFKTKDKALAYAAKNGAEVIELTCELPTEEAAREAMANYKSSR